MPEVADKCDRNYVCYFQNYLITDEDILLLCVWTVIFFLACAWACYKCLSIKMEEQKIEDNTVREDSDGVVDSVVLQDRDSVLASHVKSHESMLADKDVKNVSENADSGDAKNIENNVTAQLETNQSGVNDYSELVKMMQIMMKETIEELKQDNNNKFSEIQQEMKKQNELNDKKRQEDRELLENKFSELREENSENLKWLDQKSDKNFQELNNNMKVLQNKWDIKWEEQSKEIKGLKEQLNKQAKVQGEFQEFMNDSLNKFARKSDARIDAIETRVNKFEEENKQRFLDIKGQGEGMKDDLVRKMSGLSNKVEGIEDQVKRSQVEMREIIQKKQDTITEEVQGLKKRVDGIPVDSKKFIDEAVKEIEVRIQQENWVRENDYKVKLEKITNEIKNKLEREMKDNLEQNNTLLQLNRTSNVPVTIPWNLFFSGAPFENPCSFIQQVEDYFLLNQHIPDQAKPQFVRQMLKDSAATWFQTMMPPPKDFNEFKERFMNYYWSPKVKYDAKKRILEGKWHPNLNVSMQTYATSKIAQLRLVDPEMSVQTIVWHLTDQYPLNYQNVLNCTEFTSLERFQETLGSFDRAYYLNDRNKRSWESERNNDALNAQNQGNDRRDRWRGNDERQGQNHRPDSSNCAMNREY